MLMAIEGLKSAGPDRLLDGVRILELANKAYFLYVKQPPAEKTKSLKLVLSNCSVDATSIHPTYKKPFDLIFARAKNEEWRAQGDDFRTFLADFLASLPQIEFPDGLSW